ncbi:hypothetical protein OGM63_01270 [Plectonema radiosum NIES-515]|uniref:Histone H2A/H2B/H3 domain-containing protein n=1 Tax=Plectonema radiosum NIES-515 TaxID=2986073 RepID=A0ABT3ASS3_9CYAN|nr:hypothetical protein [Plectonema radiosum]MCV3212168.1 hypothetical protein [Plectonema radiosum NIES-515]
MNFVYQLTLGRFFRKHRRSQSEGGAARRSVDFSVGAMKRYTVEILSRILTALSRSKFRCVCPEVAEAIALFLSVTVHIRAFATSTEAVYQ